MSKHFPGNMHEGLPSLPDGVLQHLGTHQGQGLRIGIAAARFNIGLSGALVAAAVDTLLAKGVAAADIEVVWVPGSFELPLALKRLGEKRSFSALIAAGVVIEGATRHAELIVNALAAAMVRLSLDLDCPVIDAVVSARTPEQAEARCLTGPTSRGAYAALAALEVCSSLPTSP